MASSSASSSSDIPPKEKYDVFLSFRGPDTRKTFTSHLYKALDDKKIDTYIDYDLKRGEEIAPALLKAIERSKISVIVFSENYATSRWCLDELVHILECREKYGQHVIPIFYDTVVSHVRHQSGSYELEERFKDRTEKERLKWKDALTKAADLSGFVSTSFRDDSDLIQQVVKSVDSIVMKLGFESSSYELNGFVGVGSRVQQIESLLCIVPRDDRVRSVVIWGMGGIGKTTLANAVFLRLSSQFDACCFLKDVREGSGTQKGLEDLQNKLVRTLLGNEKLDIQSQTIDRSTAVKLSRKRVLVVLDDVDKSSQLEMLAGRDVTFGSGSRIIITTRDKQQAGEIVLRRGGNRDVEIYGLEKLNDDEARQFFKVNASEGICSDVDSTYFLTRMITHAAGIPLALKHWSSLSHKLSWDEMTKIINEKMGSIYRVSYVVLRKNEKEIFLDIACFHKGKQINDVRGRLDCRSLPVDSGIGDLIDRSLIELRGSYLWMHDVIQEMGREIVREKCPEEPGNRTRLYTLKHICHVLQNDTGTATIETMSIVVHDMAFKRINLTRQVFGKMYNLTFLNLDWSGYESYGFSPMFQLPQGLESLPNVLRYLSWPGYPLGTLPSKFSPSCLVELRMPFSQLQTLWNTDQKPQHLKKIDLRSSRKLVDVPYLTACLESIYLTVLNLSGCRLVSLSTSICKLKYLEILDLSDCSSFKSFPEILEPMECLNTLDLSGTKIEELHDSIENLVGLEVLNLCDCRSLKSLSNSIYKLRFLKDFLVTGCCELKKLPISSSDILWALISELDFRGCTSLEEIPDGLMKCLTSLKKLDFSETKIKSIPTSIKELSGLRSLRIRYCRNLESLPELPYNLESLEADNCRNLEMVSFSMTAVTQGLDQICYEDVFTRGEKYSFRGCKKLSETAKSNMMNDAELRILRVATAFSKREEIYPDFSPRGEDYSVTIVYTGNEIPERFRYQKEGSSINIKLPVYPSHTNTNLWQLVLCAVLTVDTPLGSDTPRTSVPDYIKPRCKFHFTTNNGDSSALDFILPLPHNKNIGEKGINWDDKSQVFVWYCAHWSTHVRYASEASFNFYTHFGSYYGIKVKRCGVCLLSSEGQDVKFVGVNQDVGEPKPEQVISTKRSHDQYEASESATVALLD